MKAERTRKPLLSLLISLITVLAVASILSVYFFRVDLTTEKRYSLSPYTKKTLRNLNDIVTVKIYLSGELNIPFRKMQQRIRETLDEFRVYAGDNVEYTFIDPFEGNKKVSDDVINELYEKGLKPTNIIDRNDEGAKNEKIVFPGALITFRDNEVPVNLLKNVQGAGADENINLSLQSLEFEFMRIIIALSADTTEKIAFIEGHGELDEYQTGDLTRDLGWYFQVDRGRINGKPGILDKYKAVVIAKPSGRFNEQDKFVLDQYLMQGGKILLFADMVNAGMDSLASGGALMALINEPGFEDMLFRYGVRINPVLVQDVQCGVIPVNVALAGNPSDFRPAPWLYSPLLNAPANQPITRGLNLISTEFTGMIDTIGARQGIEKTILLRTSEFSRIVTAPVMISLDEIRVTPREEEFTSKYLPVAVMLEGSFESAFRNRPVSSLFPDTTVSFRETSVPTGMLVVADGDMIRNGVKPTPQGTMIYPLGFDRYSQKTYGNKDFIINALQYLTGHGDLISLRSRQLTLRLLDRKKISGEKLKLILLNLAVPPLMVILAGLVFNRLRRRRYTRTR
jgi:gliding-associated putative ABC transporter substrate-binding component GldG